MRVSKEQLISINDLNYLSESSYDYTKWNLGKGVIYNEFGVNPEDKWIAPDFQAIHPMEESTAFAVVQIAAYNLSSNICYVFGVENSTTASATRRVHLWTLNRKNGTRSWNGFITMTLATATAHTVRDFKIDVKNESTGTVSVSGTAVTGTSTQFSANKVAVGARIGFGSTDPGQITTWYRVSAVGSDTSITLATSAGTVAGGTAYVIQEFRPIYVATNATTTNGGIHYGKGISIEDFTVGGTTISLAVSTDNVKAMYWLKDASTQTNIVAAGCAVNFATATATNLDAYVLDLVSAGNYKVYKYNLRAALTVASGASTSAFVLATGNQAITGTGSQNANCTFANADHGTGSGIDSIYFVSTTRVMRASCSNITNASTTWISDVVAEIPTGGTSTFTATSTLSTIEYLDSPDVFVVGTTHASANFSYITKFVSSGTAFDKIFGRDYRYNEQSLKDSSHPTVFSTSSTVFSYTNAGGNRVFAVKQGTTALLNQIYVMAFGSDWDYASVTSGRLITPEISTSNASKYMRCFVNHIDYLGGTALGKSSESYRVYVRTANIQTDATTGWTLVNSFNDLSAFTGASSIQFAIEFKTIGETCLPTRILGVNVEYEDTSTDSHYAFSANLSSAASKTFAWKFVNAFGGTVPTLEVNLYNQVSGGLLLSDNTDTPTGTFEKSTDGGSNWVTYNDTDKANDTTYIRYIPDSLADNVTISAYLVQA